MIVIITIFVILWAWIIYEWSNAETINNEDDYTTKSDDTNNS